MDLHLRGRTALVTGGSKGIGAATCRLLASEGVAVIAVARREEPLRVLSAEIEANGGRCRWIAADLSGAVGIDAVARAVGGDVDIVVNNAGGGVSKPLLALDSADWQRALDHNFLSTVALSTRLVGPMLERRWGRIVNVASIAAREPGHHLAPYAAAKAAVISFSKSLNAAVARHGVLVTTVLPGLTDTASAREQVGNFMAEGLSETEAVERLMGRRRPVTGRMVASEEVAATIAFLCSSEARSISGAAIPVDGGTLRGIW